MQFPQLFSLMTQVKNKHLTHFKILCNVNSEIFQGFVQLFLAILINVFLNSSSSNVLFSVF